MTNESFAARTLYPKRWKTILLLLVTLAFVVVGGLMIAEGDREGWFVAGIFGIGSVTFIVSLLPQASYLTLDEEGFEICSLFRKHRYQWHEVAFFGVGHIGVNKMVMFNFSGTYTKAKTARKLASTLSGSEGALHDTFGLKAEELADLMNRYKAFYA